MSEKVDFMKLLKTFYAPPTKEPVLVEVPAMQFLMLDGFGAPEGPEYHQALEALYPMAYTLKFAVKKSRQIDYGVFPLEGLWWMRGGMEFNMQHRTDWAWTAMIAQPEWVTPADVEEARVQVIKKGAAKAADIRLEPFTEGLAAQVMHIGPYAAEAPTIERLHAFIAAQGCRPRGKHHEIYLGDPRRTAPERLRTVLRQPVERIG